MTRSVFEPLILMFKYMKFEQQWNVNGTCTAYGLRISYIVYQQTCVKYNVQNVRVFIEMRRKLRDSL